MSNDFCASAFHDDSSFLNIPHLSISTHNNNVKEYNWADDIKE